MSSRIVDKSKKLPKLSLDDIAKALGMERRSSLELIAKESEKYATIGDPVACALGPASMAVGPENMLCYYAGRFAAYHHIPVKEIKAYSLMEGAALDALKQQCHSNNIIGIQFYVLREKREELMKKYTYCSCPSTVYEM